MDVPGREKCLQEISGYVQKTTAIVLGSQGSPCFKHAAGAQAVPSLAAQVAVTSGICTLQCE